LREVRIEQGSWLTIWSRMLNISEGGVCVLLPGGAGKGECYFIYLSLPDESEVALEARVCWSSTCSPDGRAWVGFEWVAPERDVLARLGPLFIEHA
jgi:hypothetical protein